MSDKNTKKVSVENDEKLLKSFVKFFDKFNRFFDNEKVDIIVNQEFAQEYALLPLLVKARMYYDEQ